MAKKENKITRVREFFIQLLDENNPKSVKRFVTMLVVCHFVVGSFLVLILFSLVSVRPTRGDIEFLKIMTDTLKIIFQYDFYIILSGLGFMGAKDFGQAMIEKAKAAATAAGDIVVQSAGTVTGGDKTTAETVNADKVDTVNTQNTNITNKDNTAKISLD